MGFHGLFGPFDTVPDNKGRFSLSNGAQQYAGTQWLVPNNI